MYLGIDLGTSEVKALVVDESGAIVASHRAPLTIQRPQPHWSEQAPQAWWEATDYLMTTLREKVRSALVRHQGDRPVRADARRGAAG
ncbi:Xylulose kinase [Serratia rubidaea]|uniref:Xylulose kinase n=1 Tax=Serratia rubidaea TaxID=61652 RepID=A0A4U9HAJ6_SERRU|nr:Xylulose kinase [Serratia rubidaea]